MRLLIVGGGPAALAAARGYRDAGGEGDVTLLTPELVAPYQRPPLSTSRTLTLGSGDTLAYDACVLATGAEPSVLPVPGATEEWVLLLRSLATARVLRDRAASARTALVVGSGFIGCEAAASLALRGVAVTLQSDEALPQHSRLGAEAGRRIAAWLEALGVTLRLGEPVDELREDAADLILMAGGVVPRAGLGQTAGLDVQHGRIVVDAHMRTSAHDVYAAGDVAFAYNAAAHERDGAPVGVLTHRRDEEYEAARAALTRP